MTKKVSKNDKAWSVLFEKFNILERVERYGRYVIKAADIGDVREARLMTKFDHEYQLPKIFRDNRLSILPISRGEYVISRACIFKKFEKGGGGSIKELHLPRFIDSISPSDITSESVALNSAYAAGIINDFLEENITYPTLNGRMGTGEFEFYVKTETEHFEMIKVDRAQIEIDACFEGEMCMCIVEAKNSINDDFIVRQLYYPFRTWEKRIKKIIRPIFFTYSNGIYHLREYEFENIDCYNSIKFVREQKYRIKLPDEELILNMELIEELIRNVPEVEESLQFPFPQADKFERVINLCEIIYRNNFEYSKKQLSGNYGFTSQDSFDPRQVDYYTNAAMYLGLIVKRIIDGNIYYCLSELGLNIFSTNDYARRQKMLIECIISHACFRKVLLLYLSSGACPLKSEVVEIMKTCNLNKVCANSTYERRASTVISWVAWILGTVEE